MANGWPKQSRDWPSPPPSRRNGAPSGKEPISPFGLSQTDSCPRSLDCTLQRRELCPPGSHACGPCLQQFVEDDHGRCPRDGSPGGSAGARGWAPGSPPPSLRAPPPPQGSSWCEPGLPGGRVGPAGAPSPGADARCSRAGRALARAAPAGSRGAADLAGTGERSRGESLGAVWSQLLLPHAVPSPRRLQKEVRLAQKADYSAQRAASPSPYDNISPGDKTLAQSAQMYHYQHQKQQMLSMEKHKEEPKLPDSASSDEENEDGDFTVYECPGLAPTGEMEVRNPLFDDSTLHPSNPKLHQ
uniref:Neural proliferation, differentiation and control 1 n=1 Tax=Dromaius novaehollandiae TaxID=8790 RepID=A0A8C4J7J5_DRONO